MSDENENNLVQRREDRRTLQKMRSKLATSERGGKKDGPKPTISAPKRNIRIWPLAIAAAVLLIGLNFALTTQQEHILSALGGKQVAKAALAPPPGASLDDQARFWAYAYFDIPKLKARFTIPKGAVINPATAKSNLERLLADNLGTEVRNEIFAMQQKAPQISTKRINGRRK